MNLNDYLTSVIRTAVPAAVGVAVTWIAKHVGVSIPAGQASAAAVALVMVAYYAAVRWAETRWPQAGWLLGVPHAPSYKPPKAFVGETRIDQITAPTTTITGNTTGSNFNVSMEVGGVEFGRAVIRGLAAAKKADATRPEPSQPNNPGQESERTPSKPRKAPAKKAPAKKVAKRTAKKAAPRKRA